MKTVSITSKALALAMLFCVAPGVANAMSHKSLLPPGAKQIELRPIVTVSSKTNAYQVKVVIHPGGRFVDQGNGQWAERGNDGANFNFRETHRDEWSVYLFDQSRNVSLQLDLHTSKIMYGLGNEAKVPLYNIVQVESASGGQPRQGNSGGQIGQAVSATVVEYTCNEGIPLIVRYENSDTTSRAFFSHDSFPEIMLENVRSGSGARYSNGRYTLHTKGPDAILSWDGTEDVCVEISQAANRTTRQPADNGGQQGVSVNRDMVWSRYQFNDENNRGRMTTHVAVGIPETDARMGLASCFAGSTAGLPALELAAPVSGAGEGAPVRIEFSADVGPMSYSGTVKAAQHSEDYSGVRLELGFNDPLWEVLMRMNSVVYSVNGERIGLALRGSRKAITAFLQDCRTYQGNVAGRNPAPQPQPQPQPVPVPVNKAKPLDPRWATCDRFANNASVNGDVPVTVTFVNRSEGYRSIMWIGYDGMQKQMANLNPGEEYAVQTFVTHPWMITDGPGNCLEMFMPQAGQSVIEISAPNRDFGPE